MLPKTNREVPGAKAHRNPRKSRRSPKARRGQACSQRHQRVCEECGGSSEICWEGRFSQRLRRPPEACCRTSRAAQCVSSREYGRCAGPRLGWRRFRLRVRRCVRRPVVVRHGDYFARARVARLQGGHYRAARLARPRKRECVRRAAFGIPRFVGQYGLHGESLHRKQGSTQPRCLFAGWRAQ